MTCKDFKNIILTYLAMIFTMTVLLTAACCIPASAIHDNVMKSCSVLAEETNYRDVIPGFKYSKLDNYGEALMLSVAWSGDSSRPYTSAMAAPYRDVKDESFVNNLSAGKVDKLAECDYLARYWNGYIVVLKPALLLFDYRQLRAINHVVFLLVVALSFYLLYRHVSKFAAWSFIGLFVALGFFIVPLNLEFSNSFYLALGAMIAVIWLRRRTSTISGAAIMFFAFGGITAFVDLFTIPVFILGLPLIAYMLLHRPCKACTAVCLLMIFWAGGYVSIWVSKWIICTLTTDTNAFDLAFKVASTRLSDFSHITIDEYPEGILQKPIYAIVHYNRVALTIFIAAMSSILYLLTCRKRGFINEYGWLIITAAIPFVYYAVANNHFLIHYWFTWRSMFITAWSVLLLMHEYRRFPANGLSVKTAVG